MRNIVFIVIAFVLSFSGRVCAGNPVYSDNSLRNDAEKLLVEWVDVLLAYQCEGLHPSLDGGILCPACARIHGRIGDTVLPLMYLADKTGNDKYLLAAKKLMKWMENVHRPDGSWMNDVHVSDWSGTTVFAAIALYEAVHYHGHLLDDSTRNHWKEQLLEAGEFMMKNPQMYSRRMHEAPEQCELFRFGDVCLAGSRRDVRPSGLQGGSPDCCFGLEEVLYGERFLFIRRRT